MSKWQRNLYAVCAAQLLTLIGFSSYLSFIPYYLQTLTGFTDSEAMNWTAGFQTAGMLAMMIAAPIWGGLADRFGRKIMLIRSTGAALVLVALMGIVTSPTQLLLLRILQGVFCGTVSAAMTLVATGTPAKSLGRSLGMLQMTQFLANAVGPFLGGLAADALGYRAVFPGAAALMAISTLTIVLLVHETRDASAQRAARPKFRLSPAALTQMVGANALILIGSLTGTSFANSVLMPVIPMYVKSLAPDADRLATLSGSLTSVTAVAAAIAAVGIGWVGDRFGQKKTLLVSMVGVSLLAIPQAFVSTATQLMVWRGIHGVFMGGILPTANALLAGSTPAGRRGSVLGLASGAQAGGNAVGPAVGAAVANAWGMQSSFFATSAVFALLTMLVGAFVRVAPTAEPAPAAAALAPVAESKG